MSTPSKQDNGELAPVVAFDGPGGSGKGTLSRLVAARLGWHLLDSGALYRLVAVVAAREGWDPEEPTDVDRAAAAAAALDVAFPVAGDGSDAAVLLAGENVTGVIRDESVARLASGFAAHPPVRTALLELQRRLRRAPGLIADGRDMGTVVFPDADLKLYVTASPDERARRRYEQLSLSGGGANIDQIYRDIVERDARDQARTHSPMKPAADAVEVDTTGEAVEQTLARVFGLLSERGLA